MAWFRRSVQLRPRSRGCHLVTSELLDGWTDLGRVRIGLLHVFLQHTSASLTVNENADGDVRADLESSLNRLAPENLTYLHRLEGPDDMPAHVKASLLGCSLTIPVGDGKLMLGTWQGIYLCEHRNHGGARRVVLTVYGDLDAAP